MMLTIAKLQVIDKKYLDNLIFDPKLSEVELYGLEFILSNLRKN